MTKRVLFIDDQYELLESALRVELEPNGIELKCEADPSRTLHLIASFRPDVVLLDILFPDGYLGRPTLERIKRKYPNLPVMMITSTMEHSEYRPEDYVLADYRFAKLALTEERGFEHLVSQLEKLIEKNTLAKQNKGEKTDYDRFGLIIGKTTAMMEVAETIEKVADQDHTVLITGESGTGKELVAKAIHNMSKREKHNFSTIVCAAMPKELLESELFGHEKGSFTGAASQKKGKFEVAGDGTIFLDEIGDLAQDTQVKLLRFLQEKKFERVGGNTLLVSNARIIAATNRNLRRLIEDGSFREDLFFRLNVVTISLPPLRERREDIPVFYEFFIRRANHTSRKNVLPVLRDDLKEKFLLHPWPGNLREFENAITRAVALADENILQTDNFPDMNEDTGPTTPLLNLNDISKRVYNGDLGWVTLTREFASKGSLRKDVLLLVIERWIDEHHRRPTSQDLARLLSISPGNMRRVLSELGIKLTQLPGKS